MIKKKPICNKNVSKPIKKENDDDRVLKTEPAKKSCFHPSFEVALVHQFLGRNLDDAELVAKKLPGKQKKNAAGMAAFAAIIHLQQEVHV